MTLIRNGVDMEPPGDVRLEQMKDLGRKTIGLSPEDHQLLCLFVGQLRKEKGVLFILDALKELKNMNVPFDMVFVGTGPEEQKIQKTAESYGIAGQIKLLGGIYDREILGSVFAAADLLLFPSRYDMDSLVPMEAAIYQTPSVIIRGATTVSSERYKDGENVFLIDNHHRAMAEVVCRLVKNPGKIRSAGELAQRDIPRSWRSIVQEEVQAAYRKIIWDFSLK